MSNWRTIEHPAIRDAERTGYASGKEPRPPVCPECGAETDTVYCRDGEVVGCDRCVHPADAWIVCGEAV